jgi:hypothetical protein
MTMTVSTKLAAVVAGGLLLATAYAPAWAQSAPSSAPAAPAASSVTTGPSILGFISPLLNTTVEHKAQKNCKPDSLYSQHSVVGDPDACFQNKVDVRTSGPSGGFAGIL